jgi:hypothetical protein
MTGFPDGFNKDGFDRNGYDIKGLDKYGCDRDGDCSKPHIPKVKPKKTGPIGLGLDGSIGRKENNFGALGALGRGLFGPKDNNPAGTKSGFAKLPDGSYANAK